MLISNHACGGHRKALGKNVALEQATALAAGAWNGLSKDKQSPYDHIAAVEKKNFDRAMQQYKEQVSAYGKQQVGSTRQPSCE